MTGGLAEAAKGINGGSGNGTAISPDRREGCSTEAKAASSENIAIGCGADAKDDISTFFFDRESPVNNSQNGQVDISSYYRSIAVGANSSADRGSVSFGHGSKSEAFSVSVGPQAKSAKSAVAIGPAALALGNTALALGRQSTASGDFAQAIGNVSIAEGKGSLAMGHSATATGNRSIAIGSADIDNAGSTGDQQGVMYQTEQQTLSTGKDSIAIGAAAKAEGDYTLAVGAHARANGSNSTAMGYDSSATGDDSFAAGRSANAEGQDAFALGANAHGKGIKSFAMGTESKAIGENALALGSGAHAMMENSIALGIDAKANFADSVALGSGAIVSHDNSISIGTKSTTNDYDATAFLYEDGVAGAVATGAVSIGNGAGTTENGASNERRLQNLAAGSLDTDAVNVSQLKLHKAITDKTGGDIATHLGGNSQFDSVTGEVTNPTYTFVDNSIHKNVGSALDNIDNRIDQLFTGKEGLVVFNENKTQAVLNPKLIAGITDHKIGLVLGAGAEATYLSEDGVTEKEATESIVFGNQAIASQENGNIAIGQGSQSTGKTSIAIGKESESTGYQTISLGFQTKASGDNAVSIGHHTVASGSHSFALGVDANALADDSTAIGNEAFAEGFESVAIGSQARALEEGSYALGAWSQAKGFNSTVIGTYAKAEQTGSVAIGSESIAKNEYEVSFGRDAIPATDETPAKEAITRKLTYVSKGVIAADSTDAVNGSQLYTTNKATVEALGGGSKLDSDGNIEGPTYNFVDNSSHKNVGDALGNLDKRIDKNVTNITGNTTTINSILKGEKGIIQVTDDGKSLIVDNSIAGNADLFNIAGGPDKNGSRKLTGLMNGEVKKGSRDAITGDQLHDVSELVDENTKNITKNKDNLDLASDGLAVALGGGAAIIRDGDNNFTFKKPSFELTNNDDSKVSYDNVGDALGHLDTNIQNVNEGKAGLVQLDGDKIVIDNTIAGATDAKSFDISNVNDQGEAVDRTLTGVEKGQLDNDAVNVAQLKEVDTKVADNSTKIDNNTTLINNQGDKITTITNKQDNSLKGIEDAFGAGAEFDKDGNLTSPNYSEALGLTDQDVIEDGVEAGFEHVGGKLAKHDQSITNIDNSIKTIDNSITEITSGKAGLVQLDGDKIVIDNTIAGATDAKSFDISNLDANGDAEDRTLTGVAAGKLDNDAVNVAQLKEVDTKVADNSTKIDNNTTLINNQGDKITTITNKQDNSLKGIEDAFGAGAEFDKDGNLTSPNYSEALGLTDQDVIEDGVEAGFEHVGGKLVEHDQSITNIDNSIKTIDNSITEITSGKAGLVQLDGDKIVIDNTIAGATDAKSFDISNLDANGDAEDRTLTGVAAGKLDNDAVNVAQLKEVDTKVADNSTKIDNNTTLINSQGDQITNITKIQGNSLTGIEDAFGGDAKFDDEGNLTMPNYRDALTADKDLNSVYDGFEYVNDKLTGITAGAAGLVKLDGDKIVIDNTIAGATDAKSFDISNLDANGDAEDRTLTGVEKGQLDNDAVNVAQLKEVDTKVADNSTKIDNNTTLINKQGDKITTITNKQDNSLKGIEDAFGAGAKFDKDGNLTSPNYSEALGLTDQDAIEDGVEAGFEHVGSKLAEHDQSITNIDNSITEINSGKAGLVQLDGDKIVIDNAITGAKDAITFDISNINDQGEAVARTLTGVEEGELSATSKDAVNGSQLFATNEQVGENTTNIKNLGDSLTTIEGDVAGNTTNITKQGKTLEGVAEALGGGSSIDAITGELSMPNYKEALGAAADVEGVEEGFKYVGGKLTAQGDQITNIEGDITEIHEGKAGLVQLNGDKIVIDNTIAGATDAKSFDFSNVNDQGEVINRTLTGVAKGAADNDAVNVSQLKKVTESLGGGSEVDADGNVTGPTYNITNKDGDTIVHHNVGSALEEIDNSVTNITNKTGQSLTGIEKALGGGASFDVDGNLTMPNYKDALSADTDLNSVYEGFEYVNGKLTGVTDGTAGLIKLSDDKKSLVVDNSLASEATSFDFGNNGIDRTLTGVAKGAADNDAVNVSQLKKVTEGLGGGSEVDADGNVTGPTYNITNKDGDTIVHHNVGSALEEIDNSVTNITNKTGQSLTGIEKALGGGASFDVDGNLTMPNYKDALSADKDLNSVNDGFEYVGGKLTEQGNQITNIDNRVTKTEGDITNITSGKAGLVQLSDDNKTIVIDNNLAKEATKFDISNNGTNRKLDGVANGRIAKDSAEAVNGGQLYNAGMYLVDSLGAGAVYNLAKGEFSGLNFKKALAAEEDIETVEDGFAYLKDNLQSFEDGEAGLLRLDDKGNIVFSDKAKDRVFNISNGDDARALTGVKAGAVTETSLEAINGSQLYATNKSIVDSLGGGAELNDDGSIKGPTYVINGDNYNNVGSALENIDGRVIDNTKNITNLTENINNINTGKAGLVMIDGDKIVFDSSIAGGRTFDISNNGQARKMTGVADGTVAAGSKDAVNGGQLYDSSKSVAEALGGGSSVNQDGKVTAPNYKEALGANKDLNSVNDGFEYVGGKLADHEDRITNIEGDINNITNGTAGLVKLETDENGNQKLVIDNGLAKDAGTFDISNGEDGRTLTGVADGKVAEGSKDAINGGQLHDSNKTIADIFGGGATVDANGYVSMPEYDFGDKNTFDNVGDSLSYLNNKITSGEGGLFKLDRDNNQIILADNKDINKDTVVNMGDRKIVGVANGKVEENSLEAVNGGQLWETNQQVSSNTNQIKHINNTLNHYNTRINNLEKTVHENRKRASAGTASAMAMSSIPYLDYAKYSFGMGVASYDGEAAMSMGLEFKMGDNGRFRIQGSYDTQNKAGVGVGMAFEL